jgi:hypothetical protein
MAQFWRLKWLKWAYLHVFAGRVEGVLGGQPGARFDGGLAGFCNKTTWLYIFWNIDGATSGPMSTGIRHRKLVAGRG